MNTLDLVRLRQRTPYSVWADGDVYLFKTDFDIVYAVDFKEDFSFGGNPAYWFALTNRSQKPSPGDPKVKETVICILEEFFCTNPDILLYMCDTADDQQAQRDRLFLRWFNQAAQRQHYVIKTAQVIDEGIMNYIAIIIPRSHPDLEAIIRHFDEEIRMFRDDKP